MCCWVGLWTSQRSWWSDLLLTAENITTERKQCVGVWMGALCRSFTGCADLYLWPRCVSRADGRAAPASSVVSVGAGLTNRPTASCSPSCCCLVEADISVKKKKTKRKIPLQNKRKVLCAECWSTFPFRESTEGTSWLLCTLSCRFSCSELFARRVFLPVTF